MANTFIVPFNYQPVSSVVKTAPTTLGSDEYARLVVLPSTEQADNSPQGDKGITIDGTLAVPQLIWESTDFDVGKDITIQCAGTLYIIATSANLDVDYKYGATTTAVSYTTANTVQSFDVAPSCVITPNANNVDIIAWLVPAEPVQTEFWLAPETVISSGDGTVVRPYLLEIYKAYS